MYTTFTDEGHYAMRYLSRVYQEPGKVRPPIPRGPKTGPVHVDIRPVRDNKSTRPDERAT